MHVAMVIGYQSFTSSALASAVGCSTNLLTDGQGNKANACFLSSYATTGAVRFRDDGTSPTASTGLRIVPAAQPFLYQGDVSRLRFINEGYGSHASLEISYVQVVD